MKSYKIMSFSKLFITLSMLFLHSTEVRASPAHRPRFIAIPLEDVQLVELEDLYRGKGVRHAAVRVPRQIAAEPAEDVGRFERQAGHHDHHHEYVDFGAHTGHHGSFGWYADFPVKDPGH